jgi:hypothetical protein
VGRLEDGVAADAVDVALANCGPISEAPAPVPQTGQTQCWNETGSSIPCDGTGQDGDIQAGVAWPDPRFTDNGNGTVRDNLTGLIWLKNADCFGLRTWAQALTDANTLASPNCGLSDGSVAGDWNLPSVKELQSLIDFGFFNPTLSNAAGTGQCTATYCAFSGVQPFAIWSSSTSAGAPVNAWGITLGDGGTGVAGKERTLHVWPVKGGD